MGVNGRAARLQVLLAVMLVLVTAIGIPESAQGAKTVYGARLSYSQTSSEAGTRTSESTQEKVSMYYNFMSNPSNRITLNGDINVDVLMRESGNNETTEVQPRVLLGLNSKMLQLAVGYRSLFRDNTVQSGTTAQEQHTENFDYYADMVLILGKLPDIRARYSTRGGITEDGFGTKTSDSETSDLSLGINENIAGLAVSADYYILESVDNLTGFTSNTDQISAQASYSFALGRKVRLSLRHNINMSTVESGDNTSENSVNTSQINVSILPIARCSIGMLYQYQINESEQTSLTSSTSASSTDSLFVAGGAYSFPKYLTFSGSFSTRELDTGNIVNKSNVYAGSVSFSHRIKNIAIKASYDTRTQNDSTTDSLTGVQTADEQTRERVNFGLYYMYSKHLKASFSDAYATSDKNGRTSENNRMRLKLQIGPWHDLTLSPYIDYSNSTSSNGAESTSTELVAQLRYVKKLHNNLNISFTDSYRQKTSESGTRTNESSTNNATLRLNVPKVLNNLNMSMDATYSTSSSRGTSSDNMSYNYRLSWNKLPHRLNLNLGYRTGSNAVDTYRLSASYGLTLRWRYISCTFSANYTYSETMSNPTSSAQSAFLSLSLRK